LPEIQNRSDHYPTSHKRVEYAERCPADDETPEPLTEDKRCNLWENLQDLESLVDLMINFFTSGRV
jgi:hypothetical protein